MDFFLLSLILPHPQTLICVHCRMAAKGHGTSGSQQWLQKGNAGHRTGAHSTEPKSTAPEYVLGSPRTNQIPQKTEKKEKSEGKMKK